MVTRIAGPLRLLSSWQVSGRLRALPRSCRRPTCEVFERMLPMDRRHDLRHALGTGFIRHGRCRQRSRAGEQFEARRALEEHTDADRMFDRTAAEGHAVVGHHHHIAIAHRLGQRLAFLSRYDQRRSLAQHRQLAEIVRIERVGRETLEATREDRRMARMRMGNDLDIGPLEEDLAMDRPFRMASTAAGDLLALWLLARRTALQSSVHGPALERGDALPRRLCL